MEPHQHIVLALAVFVSAICAVLDWRKGEIPNWITFGTIALAPMVHVARMSVAKEPLDTALQEGAFSLGGATVAAIVPLLLFRQSALGGGDVKLFIALGALLQPMLGVESQMYGFFAGAILAPARLAYDGKLLATLRNAFAIGANLFLPKSRQRTINEATLSWFKLGPAIFLGVLLTAYLHW